jgi:hypothetical protein
VVLALPEESVYLRLRDVVAAGVRDTERYRDLEVAWDELAVDGYADSYPEFFVKVYFQPLVRALTAITIDDLGRDALRAGLSKIVVRNSGQYANAGGLTFADSVLTMDRRSDANIDDGDERAKQLQQLLESSL